MTLSQQNDTDLLKKIETSGPILSVALIEEGLKRQESLTAPLLEIFTASRMDNWELTSDPRWFRGDHAGKFLIAYQCEAALPTFAQIFASSEDSDLDKVEWFNTDLAHFGETAVPVLIDVLKTDTQGEYHYGRAIAATTLKIIALQQPNTREMVLTALRALLPETTAVAVDEMWTNIVLELADLKDADSREKIEGMYKADLLDADMLPLADYQAAFAADTPEPPEAAERFDILAFYEELRHQENHQTKMTGRWNLLRRQGYIPPEPDPKPYTNRFSRWFNERLLGTSKE